MEFCVKLLSLPLWERGLKFNKYTCWDIYTFVAPLVGAWIEMIKSRLLEMKDICRSPCGSVD